MQTESEIKRLKSRLLHNLKHGGLLNTFKRGADKIIVLAAEKPMKSKYSGKRFPFFKKSLPLFIHSYNATWRNERSVEIAAALDFLDGKENQQILELGNVLSYYHDFKSVVVDKYEQSSNCINEDFLDYDPKRKFDGFISISTLEHVGWDEPEKHETKAIDCIHRVKDLVSDLDNVLISFPLNYNPYLDAAVRQKKLPFKETLILVRKDPNLTWEEATITDAQHPDYAYSAKYYGAAAVFFGIGLK